MSRLEAKCEECWQTIQLRSKLGGKVLGEMKLLQASCIVDKLVEMQKYTSTLLRHTRPWNFVKLFAGDTELTNDHFLFYHSLADEMLLEGCVEEAVVAEILSALHIVVDVMYQEDNTWAVKRLTDMGYYVYEPPRDESTLRVEGGGFLGVVPEVMVFDVATRTKLSVGVNSLGLGDISIFPNLTQLVLEKNYRYCSSLLSVPLKELRVPDLTNHVLLGIQNHRTLERLVVAKCSHIPESLQGLSYLKHLNITTFCPPNIDLTHEPFPTELGYLTNLESLAIETFKYKGCLPSEIGLLTKLKELTIRYSLEGNLPSEFGKLVNLQVLDFNSNLLFYDYKFSACTMPKLTKICARYTKARFKLGHGWTGQNSVWTRCES